MKRVCLYSMHFGLCVLCICTMALVLSGCSGRNEKQTGVADRMSGESEKRGYIQRWPLIMMNMRI
ncbi:hypothetical protein [Lachnospira eligens]|uniref:hypothetical protein n=1 Tax=Lachnospira eligens TaxID=39485 RepID=UPI001248A340|nr:hypothetical protein [Lachnospira eligens]